MAHLRHHAQNVTPPPFVYRKLGGAKGDAASEYLTLYGFFSNF